MDSQIIVDGQPVTVPTALADELYRLRGMEHRLVAIEAQRHERLYGAGAGADLYGWLGKQHQLAHLLLGREEDPMEMRAKLVGEGEGGNIHPWSRIGGRPEVRDLPAGELGVMPEIDRTARISAFCTVDSGMDRATRIGARTWLMQHSHVGHDALVGDDVEIAGAWIGGYAVIEDRARIGMGALVMAYRRVGAGAVVGTGAVVTKDVPAGMKVAGNPAQCLGSVAAPTVPFSQRATMVRA